MNNKFGATYIINIILIIYHRILFSFEKTRVCWIDKIVTLHGILLVDTHLNNCKFFLLYRHFDHQPIIHFERCMRVTSEREREREVYFWKYKKITNIPVCHKYISPQRCITNQQMQTKGRNMAFVKKSTDHMYFDTIKTGTSPAILISSIATQIL